MARDKQKRGGTRSRRPIGRVAKTRQSDDEAAQRQALREAWLQPLSWPGQQGQLVPLPPNWEREQWRPYLARVLQKSTAEVTDEVLDEYVRRLQVHEAQGEPAFARWTEAVVNLLYRLKIQPHDVAAYRRLERQTAASLYLEATRPHPSQAKLKQLALRFALDARRPFGGHLLQLAYRRTEAGWVIAVDGMVAAIVMPDDFPGQLVNEPWAVQFLDTVFQSADPSQDLITVIEWFFGRAPTEAESLGADRKPAFTFCEASSDEQQLVELRIAGRRVEIPNWRDIHHLLQRLCGFPEAKLVGKDARAAGVVNPSQACGKIRAALEAAHAGAGDWLQTSPIGWKPGFAPRERRRSGRPRRPE